MTSKSETPIEHKEISSTTIGIIETKVYEVAWGRRIAYVTQVYNTLTNEVLSCKFSADEDGTQLTVIRQSVYIDLVKNYTKR
jgi:hypothetical protein